MNNWVLKNQDKVGKFHLESEAADQMKHPEVTLSRVLKSGDFSAKDRRQKLINQKKCTHKRFQFKSTASSHTLQKVNEKKLAQ